MRKRRIFAVALVLLLVAGIATVVYLRAKGAPEAARLLPEGKVILYVDLATVRLATSFGDSPVEREKEYEEFVQATGFQFERDLDEVALVMHEVPVRLKQQPAAPTVDAKPAKPEKSKAIGDASAPTPAPAAVPIVSEPRYSEILIGRFNSERVTAWLRKEAGTVDRFGETEIFNIPHEDRTVRVAILDVETVAISNAEDSQVIRGMVERHRSAAHPFAGPALVRTFYRNVPFASVAWAIAEVAPKDANLPSDALKLSSPMRGWLGGSRLVASISYKGFINLRVQALTETEKHAQEIEENATAWLNLFRIFQIETGQAELDNDIKQFFESIEVKRKGNRTVMNAKVSPGMIAKIFADPPVGPSAAPEAAPAAEESAPSPVAK
jgi:hypothetical protein